MRAGDHPYNVAQLGRQSPMRGGGEPLFKSRYDREWGVVVNIDPGSLFKL